MSHPLEFTGERFVPGTEGEIAHEHWHRYAFARGLIAGKRVLDVACGEGYGSALLSEVAESVTGVDIDDATIAHAIETYPAQRNLRFIEGSATALPLAPESVDAIVSFETVEHLDAADQQSMIAEFARVLAPGGWLVLSSPNRPEYSDARSYANPFHRHELDRDELGRLLDAAFPARRWYRQRRYLGSALWAEERGGMFESFAADEQGAEASSLPVALYFVVVAARNDADLPQHRPALSLLCDRGDREWQRIDNQSREVLRLDALLRDRDAALDRQAARVYHLEALVAERERLVAARDAQLAAAEGALNDVRAELARTSTELAGAREATAAYQDECARLEKAIVAQERIIAYRQSARWWVALPWLRIRLLWKRIAG
jgi:SAM-dependent methyltransferase